MGGYVYNFKQFRVVTGEELVGILDYSNLKFKYNWDYRGVTPIELYPEGNINIEPSSTNIIKFVSNALGLKRPSVLDISEKISDLQKIEYGIFTIVKC